MPRQLILLVLACSFFTGCYTTHRFPAVQIPVRLVSEERFQLQFPASADTPTSSCGALRADVEVSIIRSDTLFFRSITALQQPPGVSPCAHRGAGLVALAEYPQLRAERPVLNRALTAAGVILAVPFALVSLTLIACATFADCIGT